MWTWWVGSFRSGANPKIVHAKLHMHAMLITLVGMVGVAWLLACPWAYTDVVMPKYTTHGCWHHQAVMVLSVSACPHPGTLAISP